MAISASIRQRVRERAKELCEYCHLPERMSPLSLQIEHVIAKQHRGSDDLDNLALACLDCNLHKGPNLSGIDPDSGQIENLFNPRTQVWEEHFAWEDPVLIGTTATGRTTIWTLDMNSEMRIASRKRWKT